MNRIKKRDRSWSRGKAGLRTVALLEIFCQNRLNRKNLLHSVFMDTPQFPMRINKYLASKKYATRRGADELIKQKLVRINGRLAELGDKVGEHDVVSVSEAATKNKKYLYFAYFKPAGIVTHSPQKGEEDIAMNIPLKGVFPLGRLDKESYGLIILTNDGRITESLLNPQYGHEKEYAVRTSRKLRNSFKREMETGVDIGEYITKECKVYVTGDTAFRITIKEGKRHQIRRMCAALHVDVIGLERIRIMNIKLGVLKPGEYRPIQGKELATFLSALGFRAAESSLS